MTLKMVENWITLHQMNKPALTATEMIIFTQQIIQIGPLNITGQK